MKFLGYILVTALAIGPTEGNVVPSGELTEKLNGGLPAEDRENSYLHLRKRLANGQVARSQQFTSMCSLQMLVTGSYIHYCGAVIYDDWTLITAASCLIHQNLSDLRAVCGEYDLRVREGTEQTAFIVDSVVHPGFRKGDRNTFRNDIALLDLDTSLTFDGSVQPAIIDNGTERLPRNCHIAGWGSEASGLFPTKLLDASVARISNLQCLVVSRGRIVDENVCFTDFLGRTAACEGDFGGPVYCGNVLTGIGSYGPRLCGQSFLAPSVFTRVSEFTQWIVYNAFDDGVVC